MLGIDIGAYSVKAAVTKKSGKRVSIERLAAEVLPIDKRGGSIDINSLQAIVATLVKKVGKGQDTVALGIPTASVILKNIQVDTGLSDDLLEGEVQLAMVDFVPFPLDQVYADFIRLGKSEQNPDKEDILVAASRRDIVDKIANSVSVKSIRHKEVDVEVFAIGQVLEKIKGKNYRDTYAVIDIGYVSTTICVFQAGRMLFSREQQVGGHHLTEAIAEANGVGLQEAENIKHNTPNSLSAMVLDGYFDSVSEQVALALEFFGSTNDNEIQTVYVTGGGSMVPGLLKSLAENMPNQQFEQLPIGQEIQISKKISNMPLETVGASAAVVAGLAMRD